MQKKLQHPHLKVHVDEPGLAAVVEGDVIVGNDGAGEPVAAKEHPALAVPTASESIATKELCHPPLGPFLVDVSRRALIDSSSIATTGHLCAWFVK